MKNNSNINYKIIAVDFDGTIFETNFPTVIIRPIMPVVNYLKQEKSKNGSKLILWTCRTGKYLEEAIAACKEIGLEFDAVNDNLPEVVEAFGENARKVVADIYLDDRAVHVNDVKYREQYDG